MGSIFFLGIPKGLFTSWEHLNHLFKIANPIIAVIRILLDKDISGMYKLQSTSESSNKCVETHKNVT